MYWFAFDAMGDFVFNRPFGMLEARTWHHIIVRSWRAMELLGPFSPAPWLIHIGLQLLPRLGKIGDWHEITMWCRQTMEQRLKDEALQKNLDMTHYRMMNEDTEQEDVAAGTEQGYLAAREHNRFWLHGDSLLIIVAGRCVLAQTLSSALLQFLIILHYPIYPPVPSPPPSRGKEKASSLSPSQRRNCAWVQIILILLTLILCFIH